MINSARFLGIVGVLLILSLPIEVELRVVACLLWGALSFSELRQFRRGYRNYAEIRVAPGSDVQLRNQHQEWVPAELLGGSVLLGSIGWLRLKTADGSQFAELLCGNRRQSREWRHLHVIWRHIGAND